MRLFVNTTACLALMISARTATAQIQPGDLFFASQTAVYNIKNGGNFSNATPFATGFGSAEDLCIGPNGDLFVSDFITGNVHLITAGGDYTNVTPFAFGMVSGGTLACSPTQILASDVEGGAVYDITNGGNVATMVPFAIGFDRPGALYRDLLGDLWVDEVPLVPPANLFDITAGGDFTNVIPFASSATSVLGGMAEHNGQHLVTEVSSGRVVSFGGGGDLAIAPTFASGIAMPAALEQAGPLGLMVTSFMNGTVHEISAGGDFTNAVPFATGLTPDFGGMAYVDGSAGGGGTGGSGTGGSGTGGSGAGGSGGAGAGGSGGSSPVGGNGSGASGGSAIAASSASSVVSGSTVSTGAGPSSSEDDDSGGGCNCRSAAPQGMGDWLPLLPLVALLRRRQLRRSQRSPSR